jgi:hypothetical protein
MTDWKFAAWTVLVIGSLALVFVAGVGVMVGGAGLISTGAHRMRLPASIPGWWSQGSAEFVGGAGKLGGVHIGGTVGAPSEASLAECERRCADVAGCNAVTYSKTVATAGHEVNCLFDNYPYAYPGNSGALGVENPSVQTAVQVEPNNYTYSVFGGILGASLFYLVAYAVVWIALIFSNWTPPGH